MPNERRIVQSKTNVMSWEQKLEAMIRLCGARNVSLRMREPGDWYVEVEGRYIGGNGILQGACGNGSTPQQAVEDDWKKYVIDIGDDFYIVAPNKLAYRWNGFMWKNLSR